MLLIFLSSTRVWAAMSGSCWCSALNEMILGSMLDLECMAYAKTNLAITYVYQLWNYVTNMHNRQGDKH